jgi:hypothetical protein
MIFSISYFENPPQGTGVFHHLRHPATPLSHVWDVSGEVAGGFGPAK